jgi:hypothetical protein
LKNRRYGTRAALQQPSHLLFRYLPADPGPLFQREARARGRRLHV